MDTRDQEKAMREIRRLVREFDDHPWDINNGRCDTFADKLVEALGEGAEAFWVTDLPDYGFPREDNDICHAVVLWKGHYFDAEEPIGAKDWRHLPCCARALRFLASKGYTETRDAW